MAKFATINLYHSRSIGGFPTESVVVSKIFVEDGLFRRRNTVDLLNELLTNPPTSFVVITDTRVNQLYGEKIAEILERVSKTRTIVIPSGERSKSMEQCSRILSRLSKLGFDRDGVLILFGGGVVGDLGGFVASIYKRGVRYVQVPTTLLAQVDSGIGGKTGIDTSWGKNQVGAIFQPVGTLIDQEYLRSLPGSEILNGVGEIIKYGVVASDEIFCRLEKCNDFESIEYLKDLIAPCCRIKARVVTIDEHDQNVRSILNYGHTVGHALETTFQYRIGHGVSVMVGMLCEGWISFKLGIFPRSDLERQEELIKRIIGRSNISLHMPREKILEFVSSDKKNLDGKILMSLPEKIGTMHKSHKGRYKVEVPESLLRDSISHLNDILLRR